jgi:regulator of protease activity HflC (stomatin/prohibitin superfamily)
MNGEPMEPTPLSRFLAKATRRALVALVLVALVGLFVFITSGFVIVDKGQAAVLIRKTGDELPSGQIIAAPGQRGIQADPLPEGWYWYNPYTWDFVYVDQVEIKQGEVGVKIRNFGADLRPGQIVAEDGQKGILKDKLGPGRYLINTLAYSVKKYPAVTIEAGHVGVVTRISDKLPANPNDWLVEEGERGVQKKTLGAGTYYPHPFYERIHSVDTRAHRFDMIQDKIIRFPSQDGFDITMEGTIEWYINPDRVAEVYVKYVDERDVMTCVVEDIILPSARAFSRIEGSKHLARDFIGGLTREKFQEEFLTGLKNSCARQGIVIQSALVRQITPPDAIARPIKDREIAIRMREMYTQEMERERQQKLLAMEQKMKDRKTQTTQAGADVSVAVTKAEQEKQVAIIEANRQLEVAQLQLTAAQNQAQAKVAEGRAKADVILFKNTAEAAGLKNAASAFGEGNTYVRYLMNQKLAPSMTYILSNTDGPFAEMLRRAIEGTRAAPTDKPAQSGPEKK